MRSLGSILLVSLVVALSFAGCTKKDQTQDSPAASNETAATTTAATQPTPAPSQSLPEVRPPEATQPPVAQVPEATKPPAAQVPQTTQPAAAQVPQTTRPPAFRPPEIKPSGNPTRPVNLKFKQYGIVGYWRGTTKSKLSVVCHFDEDGLGSVDLDNLNFHLPKSRLPASAAITTISDKKQYVTIFVLDDMVFSGTMEGRKMIGKWLIGKSMTEDIQLIKQ